MIHWILIWYSDVSGIQVRIARIHWSLISIMAVQAIYKDGSRYLPFWMIPNQVWFFDRTYHKKLHHMYLRILLPKIGRVKAASNLSKFVSDIDQTSLRCVKKIYFKDQQQWKKVLNLMVLQFYIIKKQIWIKKYILIKKGLLYNS